MRRPSFLRLRLYLVAASMLTVACRGASPPPATSPVPPRPDNSANSNAVSTLPPGFTALQIAEGDSLFNHASCWRCHGIDARGSANGPALRRGVWQHGTGTIADIAHTIETGVPTPEIKDSTFELQMNPNPSRFTPSQIRSVAAYIWTVSRAREVKKSGT